jgi:hypothetical protein
VVVVASFEVVMAFVLDCSVMAVCGRFEMRAGDSCYEVELVVRVRHGLERQHYWR